MKIDGSESFALTLEWLAAQVRAGIVQAVSMEVADSRGRVSVVFALDTEPVEVPGMIISHDDG